MLWDLLRASSRIAIFTGLVVFGLAILLSKRWTNQVKMLFEIQRSFMSDASHELKTPLTILNAAVDLLETERGGDKRIDMIKTQIWRMNDLVTDMLTLSHSDEKIGGSPASKGHKKTRHTSLSDSILMAATEFESRAFEEGKHYKIDVQRGLRLNMDEESAERLVRILLDNAIKYSDDGGSIELSLRAVDSRPMLSVYNTGCGIPEDERGKVFERFYRSDKSRSRETGGFGLGLSIAKAITDNAGSRINIDGNAGEWVRFTVTF
jgi:signal transduction histidine kinase